MIEDFLHLPPVSLTPVANFELQISPRIFEQIWNDPNGILQGLRETDSWKKPEVENLVTLCLFQFKRNIETLYFGIEAKQLKQTFRFG